MRAIQKNDQIFQLSLTEIAFTIAFILLLLLGWMLLTAERKKEELETHVTYLLNQVTTAAAIDAAQAELSEAIRQVGIIDPDQVVSRLLEQKNIFEERETLKQRVEELDKQLTALTELQAQLARASDMERNEKLREEIYSALRLKAALKQHHELNSAGNGEQSSEHFEREFVSALKLRTELSRQMEERLRKKLKHGEEEALAGEIVRALELQGEKGGTTDTLKRENANLRGQVEFLKARLHARGGRDYPPCWADERTGKVEFLFNVEMRDEGLIIAPAWLPARERDARNLPGIEALLGGPWPLQRFRELMAGIDQDSRSSNCRHYVVLRNRITDLASFNRFRYGVENYFYKLEAN